MLSHLLLLHILLAVIVEALAALLTEDAAADHLAKQQRCAVLAVAGLIVKRIHDSKANIEADEIAEGEGAHRVIRTKLHRLVDVLNRADTLFHQEDL